MRIINVCHMLSFLFVVKNVLCDTPLCISLGDACAPALALRNLSLRHEAYPFDWTVSPFESLYRALGDNFEHFLKDLKLRPDGAGVVDYYGFSFTHDWPTVHQPQIDSLNSDFVPHCPLSSDWQKALPNVKEKYRRRIERFNNVCLGAQKVYFIRDGCTKEQAIKLRDLLRVKYPLLDFILIPVGSTENHKYSWNLDKIVNIYVKSWDNTHEWVSALKTVGPEFSIIKVHENKSAQDLDAYLECPICLLEKIIS